MLRHSDCSVAMSLFFPLKNRTLRISCLPRYSLDHITVANVALHGGRLFLGKVTCLQIPCHSRQLHNETVEFGRHLDLTAETTGLGQAECQVQHVVLIVIGLLHCIVHARVGNDDMAGGAGAGTAAGALHLQVICLS